MLTETCVPENRIEFWEKLIDVNADEDGLGPLRGQTGRKFTCEISNVVLKLSSGHFTLKFSIRLLHFNDFLFKINRKDSDCCDFCKKFPETIIHDFCECDYDKPISSCECNKVVSAFWSFCRRSHFVFKFLLFFIVFRCLISFISIELLWVQAWSKA